MTDSANLVETFKSNVLKSINTPSPNARKRKLNKSPQTSYDSDISDLIIMESPRKKLRSSNYNANDTHEEDTNDDIDYNDEDDIDREFNELFDIVQQMHSENDTDSEMDLSPNITAKPHSNNTHNITRTYSDKPRRRRYYNAEETQDTETIKTAQTTPKKKNITFKCYNCDEVGHIARNCEYEPIEICFKCGDSGHSGFFCPNTICSFCLKSHRVHECNLFAPNKKELKFCIRCGSKEHYLNQCDAMLGHRLVNLQCFVCGKYGHLNCRASNKNKRVQLCSNCASDDHTVYFCKHLKMNKAEIAIGLNTNPNDPKICFNCNEANHCSRNCPLIIRQKQQRKKNKNSKFHYRSHTISNGTKRNQKHKKRKGNKKKKRLSPQQKWRKDTLTLIKATKKWKKGINNNDIDVIQRN